MKKIRVNFLVIFQLMYYIAEKIGYTVKSNHKKGELSPKQLAINTGTVGKKAWEGALTKTNKGEQAFVIVALRELATVFGTAETFPSVEAWVAACNGLPLCPEAKAIFMADAFLGALTASHIRKDRVPIAWYYDICRSANVDAETLLLSCTGRGKRYETHTEYYKFGDYESVPMPQDFLDRNAAKIQAMLKRFGKLVSYKDYEDASQEMWGTILYYGGSVVEEAQKRGASDDEIISILGGYAKRTNPAVQVKLSPKELFITKSDEDYSEDRDGLLTARDMDTEWSAIVRMQTIDDLCEAYGVDKETAIALIKKRLG